MAVVTGKSKFITNRDTGVTSNGNYAKAVLKEAVGACSIANGDSIASKYIFAQIPSNARVSDLLIYSPDIGTTTAADIGLYKNTADGGAVVSAAFFKAAFVLNAGAVTDSQVAFGNVISLTNSEKMIWELLGLAADPCLMYDIVATLTAAADAAGVVMIKARYTE